MTPQNTNKKESKNKNTNKTGNMLERKYMDLLVSQGYVVERAIRRIIKKGNNKFLNIGSDFFGLFDLIALKDNKILFVQVTSGNWHTKNELIEFADKIKNPNITFILAKYNKEKDAFDEFRYKYNKNNHN
jgi:Holliday junction resolvase-like predicted endonuclease